MIRLFSFVFLLTFALHATAQETLTLETVISRTLAQNFNVLIERNNVTIASNNNQIANAGYLPTINATAEQSWSKNNTRQEFFSGQVNQASGAKNSLTSAAVRLDWTFFDGFRMFAADRRLQLQEDAAAIQLTAEMEMAVYQASVLYYTILQQQALTEVYAQALQLSSERYRITDLKVRNGAASELQRIQAQLDLTADSSALLLQRKQLHDLKTDLNTLMAQSPETPFTVSGGILPAQILQWEQAVEQAHNQHTSLLLAKADIAILAQQRKETQSYYYPQLGVYAQYAYTQSQNQIGILNSSRSYGTGAGFTLRWTILDRLSTYTALRNNTLQTENADLLLRQQTQQIDAELQKTFSEYEWAVANLAMEQQTVTDAEAILSIALQSLENGSITPLELREIQFSVVQAQSRLIAAQLQVKTAELQLKLTTGDFRQLLQ